MNDFLTCYLILLKATIGSGLIYYPIIFYNMGYYTLIIMFLASFFSQIGFYLYIKMNKIHGPLSISKLPLKYTYGWRVVTHFVIITRGIFVCMVYLASIREIYYKLLFLHDTNIIKNACPCYNSNNCWGIYGSIFQENYIRNIIISAILVIIHTIILVPLITLKKIKYLKFTSLLGVLSIIYLLFLAVYRYCTLPHIERSINYRQNLDDISRRIFFIVFSFEAHQVVIPIQNEYFNLSLSFFISVIVAVSVTTCGIYCLFGILISKVFELHNVYSDDYIFWNIFPDDFLSTIGMIMYIVILSTSIPLHLIPCRDQILEIYFTLKEYFAKNNQPSRRGHGHNNSSDLSETNRAAQQPSNTLSADLSAVEMPHCEVTVSNLVKDDDTSSKPEGCEGKKNSKTLSNKTINSISSFTEAVAEIQQLSNNKSNTFLIRTKCTIMIISICLLMLFWFPSISFFTLTITRTLSCIICFILPMFLFFHLCRENMNVYEVFAAAMWFLCGVFVYTPGWYDYITNILYYFIMFR
ncbi:Vacuolar amino acid transporter 4 [Cucumispora dikerogammari]|nr:Vacuolar amino acid transporter 4 [Cucumispora dikerogammari]